MSKADYLGGTLDFVLILGPVLAAAWLARRRWYGYLAGAEALTAFGLLATAGGLAVFMVPGILGVLGRVSVPLAAFALLGAVALLAPREAPAGAPVSDEPRRGGGPFTWAMAGSAAAIALVYVTAFVIDRRGAALPGIDALNFELPTVARWIQQGQIWSVGHYSVYWSFGTYPNGGEAAQGLVMLPWHSDAFVRFSMLPFLAFTAVATYALALGLRAPRPAALAWASAVVVTPACVLSAVEDTKPDTFMLACFAGGLVFLIRHTRRGATPDLVLAGIGLGLAFGSRWYGVTAVAVVVAVWAVARLLARVPLRSVVRQTLAVSGLVALMGGFWLLRNWIVAGNPVLPVKVALGGTVLFDAPADYVRTKGGFTILHYATDGAVWRDYLWPAFRNGFVLTGIVAFVACLVVLLGAVRRRRGTLDMVLVAAAAATLLLTLVYAATPYSAQGPDGSPVQALVNTRYGLPALVTGAAVAAAIGAWGRRWSLVVTLLGLVGVIDGVTRVDNAGLLPYFAHVARPTRVLEALVLLGLAAVAVLVVRWSPRSLRAVVVVAIALLVGLAGYYHQRHYIDHRYLGADPSIDAVLEMPGRHTIAITGPTPPGILPPNLPLNGPRLDNRVRVLGRPDRYVLQPLRSSADLASSLRGEPYDLLYVLVDPAKPPKEVRWARALGWRQIAQGRTSVLFRRG